MQTITIRQLHDATGRWVRKAVELGELQVTERGKVVARLTPATSLPGVPYFSKRKLLPAFRSARLAGGKDATAGIFAERDER
jgi:antitoxin (DNA-binding transcriptional repressor) of toxin-antitoxin stability system